MSLSHIWLQQQCRLWIDDKCNVLSIIDVKSLLYFMHAFKIQFICLCSCYLKGVSRKRVTQNKHEGACTAAWVIAMGNMQHSSHGELWFEFFCCRFDIHNAEFFFFTFHYLNAESALIPAKTCIEMGLIDIQIHIRFENPLQESEDITAGKIQLIHIET